MKRRWIAALLVLLMVMGTVGMAAAVEDDEDVEVNGTEEREGPPAHIQEMLDMKAQLKDNMEGEDEDDEQGPPEFVKLMLEEKFSIMSKNKLKIHGNPFVSDLPPVIKDGRTLIPVAAVVKGLGAKAVDWDNDSKTVTITTKEDETIELKIGENVYTVSKDGTKETIEMDTKAEILGNRTFVPLKYIALAMGEEIEYDEETKTVNVGRKFGHDKEAEAKLNSDEEDNDEDDNEDDDTKDDDED